MEDAESDRPHGHGHDSKSQTENKPIRAAQDGEFGKRAALFHRMAMEDFDFLEAARTQSGHYGRATLSTDDVKTTAQLKKVMAASPRGLVNFTAYGHQKPKHVSKADDVIRHDYRTRRFENRLSEYPPFDVWAKWVLTRKTFAILMILVIVLNSIVIILEGEIADTAEFRIYRQMVDTLDFLFLTIFCVDIILKFVDCGWEFFHEAWNVFDFVVTIGSLVAVVMDLVYQDSETTFVAVLSFVHYIRVFRILRSLNVVTRWRRIRLLWIAVMNTVYSLIYILLLMSIFFYIFALIGIQFFDRFTNSHIKDLEYHAAFKNLGSAMITLFQLFTLDHWYKLIQSMERVMHPAYTVGFVLMWILLGSFIFKNIFVGVMVNNFQNIRRELVEEANEAKLKPKSGLGMKFLGLDEFFPVGKESVDPATDYEANILYYLDVIKNLGDGLSPMMIPRDTLFHYFVLLEALSVNLNDRERIFALLNQALVQQYDD